MPLCNSVTRQVIELESCSNPLKDVASLSVCIEKMEVLDFVFLWVMS